MNIKIKFYFYLKINVFFVISLFGVKNELVKKSLNDPNQNCENGTDDIDLVKGYKFYIS